MNPKNYGKYTDSCYPYDFRRENSDEGADSGKTLLDDFAKAAMPILLKRRLQIDCEKTAEKCFGLVAEQSYEVARAMMEERKK